ncbi:site-specific DNA-methyltransferase [Paeniglutamicibacter sp. ABSL32-1]|uniref:site-specific DNA-methyltransferase n=1 Tax=Paeniglutamicibacter quisquiliarum TaxID=2849498 RepID=UPI001C2D43E7|nr:site-specific DNA-methyltransferase [Paeniglutamicibacter quisquiliarum]
MGGLDLHRPPYNTGNKTWQYNDHYVAEQDSFRHSKWLSFMERRLTLAKKLLKTTGVIIVAIGDDEHHRLRMLMDEIFGSNNFISDVVWQGGRKNDSRYVSNGADYMLIYSKDEASTTASGIRWREERPGAETVLAAGTEAWNESGQGPDTATALLRKWFSSLPKDHPAKRDGNYNYNRIDAQGRVFYANDLRSPSPRPNLQYDLLHPVTGEVTMRHPNGWAYSRESMDALIEEGNIWFDTDNTRLPRLKKYLDEQGFQVAMSIFDKDRRASSRHLQSVFRDKRFPFPKDHEVLMRWIRLIAPKDSIVLDFFGGSGTTAEAVIRLNAEDQGTRQCILVTNNELSAKDDAALRKAGHQPGSAEYEAKGVFHHVTKPRIETVVTGVRQDGSAYSDGLPANVEFLDLAYLEESRVHAALEYESLAPLFWLKSGAVGSVVQRTEDTQDYEWNEESSMAVLFNAGKAAELAELLATKPNQVKHVFIITDSPEQGDLAGEAFGDEITVQPIYGSYLDAFQINRSDS